MKLIAAGVGPGDPELVTVKAIRVLKEADMVIIPVSAEGRSSVAEEIVCEHIADSRIVRFVFSMKGDRALRDETLRKHVRESRPIWEGARTVAMPVLGDSALYATSAYLYSVWLETVPALEFEIIPGVSAHSLVSAKAGRFLALGDDVLSIIPGTAGEAKISAALKACDTAALFKPSGLKQRLRDVVDGAGPWSEIVRIDRAGLPGERTYKGSEALDAPDEYLSTMLLWRRSGQ